MRKFKVDFARTQYFSATVTFIEEGKDEMDAVQTAMSFLDYDEKPFFEKEEITHTVEETGLED